jgi:hypothetical protein
VPPLTPPSLARQALGSSVDADAVDRNPSSTSPTPSTKIMPRPSAATSNVSATTPTHESPPSVAASSSSSVTRRPSLPPPSSSSLPKATRPVATLAAVHRVAASVGTGDDLASSDELKVYKDEGDADDENKSSAENLDEEKRGLLTETEQVRDHLRYSMET